MDLLSICDDNIAEIVGLNWSDEFYEGEFKDLGISNLLSKETCEPVLPSLGSCTSSTSTIQQKQKQNCDVLQVLIIPPYIHCCLGVNGQSSICYLRPVCMIVYSIQFYLNHSSVHIICHAIAICKMFYLKYLDRKITFNEAFRILSASA